MTSSGMKSASVQLVSSVTQSCLFETPWTAARQASLSITHSQSLLKLMSIESVMLSNHLILCHPLLLPSIFPSIRLFSTEPVLRIRSSKYWSFSFSISPSIEYSGLISCRTGWISLLSKGLSRVFSNTIVQKHQFFGTQLSLWRVLHQVVNIFHLMEILVLQKSSKILFCVSGLKNSMDCIAHGVTKNWTGLSDFHFTLGMQGREYKKAFVPGTPQGPAWFQFLTLCLTTLTHIHSS